VDYTIIAKKSLKTILEFWKWQKLTANKLTVQAPIPLQEITTIQITTNSTYQVYSADSRTSISDLKFLSNIFTPVLKASFDSAVCPKKPTAYVEVHLDGKLVRKTEAIKNSLEPVWNNETFTVYVQS
jgi:C2 domain